MKICRLSARSGGRGSGLPEPYRVGVYYAPATDDPLWQAGCAWLGRDAATGSDKTQPDLPGLAKHTESPRRYGLHGTLKAPFTPRQGFDAFLRDATAFAAQCEKVALPTLAVTNLHGFLALCPAEPAPLLHKLADACVSQLDAHRLPESATAQARRGTGRTARQQAYIAKWGYPLVFEDFYFHMTLTDQMQDNPYLAAARAHFADSLAQPRYVESLAIFIEERQGSPFRLCCRLKLAP